MIPALFSLLALAGPPQDPAHPPATPDRIGAAIDRGVEYLMRAQEIDGSWRYHSPGYPTGITSLALYTLLKSGVPPEHPSVRRAERWLSNFRPRKTYALGCWMMALGALGDRERLAEAAATMLEWQQHGGFAYPDGERDLSNTQYAALGLRAAAQAGVPIPRKAWERLAEFALDHQREDGGFGYKVGVEPTGAMSSAGVAVLCIARAGLDDARQLSPAFGRELSGAIELGLEWLAKHFVADGNPQPHSEAPNHHWVYYYLYGIERVAALAGLERLGPHDWYQAGADWLVARQGGHGAWSNLYGEPEPTTCFALLFLERATASRGTGAGAKPAAGRGRRTYGAEAPKGGVGLRAAGDTPMSVWIDSFGTDVLSDFEWMDDAGAGPRVTQVEYLVDGAPLASVPGDGTRPARDERFAAQLRLPAPGRFQLQARVRVRQPDGEPGADATLHSPALEVEVFDAAADWMWEYAEAPARNLLSRTKVTLAASSEINGSWTAAFAADDLQSAGWACAPDDPAPWLRLDLERPQRARGLLVSHAREMPLDPGRFGRATRLSVRLNKREPFEVELGAHEHRKSWIPFDGLVPVRQIELRLVERVPGAAYGNSAGFMEVELVADEPGAR